MKHRLLISVFLILILSLVISILMHPVITKLCGAMLARKETV